MALADADVRYQPDWLPEAAADVLLRALIDEIRWTQHHVRIFGRELPSPRLSAWIGDPGASYTYSRVRHEPLPWTPTLAVLRARLRAESGIDFNSVLANRYRDGRDSMGWHADDEPELGAEPVIASVSLGATRQMRFRRRRGDGSAPVAVALEHGSLLWMAGRTQQFYQHAIHKTRTEVGERINLTFRVLFA
ncbi:MAG: alpha-ketoglutarate-dependent dioxygenase AlkB [Rhodanobacteraceae bacterium]|nr:alpha-ketoglutarate-dependent dioxygenase AlkB [Rhodanobacteraceae bacterium]